jgi:dihydrofolate reductase
MMPPIHLIFATSRNGVIGVNNQLPWHLPEDLAHFKTTTQGQTVLMGRRTWDSLPKKPLPNRLNLILTHQPNWTAPGAHAVHSINEALQVASQLTSSTQPIWVIGGAELYHLTLPIATKLVVTQIEQDVQGDTFAPHIDTTDWQVDSSSHHISQQRIPYTIQHYSKRQLKNTT